MRTALTLIAVGCVLFACAPSDDGLVIFAAASLVDVAHAAADLQPDQNTRISVGPTSLLSQQIEQGAPADVFLAAHPKWVERLQEHGLTASAPIELARGRLVIVAASGAPPARSAAHALATANRIAVADPSHVPAGEYARAALRASGVWDTVSGRILPASDVRAALVAVQHGAADVAIVYASDALVADGVAVVYRFEEPAAPEIRYVGVAVSDHPEAVEWIRQLVSPEMHAVWEARGFEPPRP